MVLRADLSLNHLLVGVPAEELRPWLRHLLAVELRPGEILGESGPDLAYAWFPTTAVISLMQPTAVKQLQEVAVIGNDSMIGSVPDAQPALDGRLVAYGPGIAWRIRTAALQRLRHGSDLITDLLDRQTELLRRQVESTRRCQREHTLAQRLCRAILLRSDRQQSEHQPITQILMATLLAASRENLIDATLGLQSQGLLSFDSGRIRIIQRAGLAAGACRCYTNILDCHTDALPERVDH